MRMKTTYVTGVSLLLMGSSAFGSETPAILNAGTTSDSLYLPDFSYAGFRNGANPLPATTGTLVTVDDFGAKPDDSIDDS